MDHQKQQHQRRETASEASARRKGKELTSHASKGSRKLSKLVVLVRHGESQAQTCGARGLRRSDPVLRDCGLSERGLSQAFQVPHRLSECLQTLQCHPEAKALVPSSLTTVALPTAPASASASASAAASAASHHQNHHHHQHDNLTEHQLSALTLRQPVPAPDLIVCSPLKRAILTTMAAFPDVDGPPILCHPHVIENGSSIPENVPRTVQELREDPELTAFERFATIDFGALPADWPAAHEARHRCQKQFPKWLALRPERFVVVVCHFNTIRMLTGFDGRVKNCNPMPCRYEHSQLTLLSVGPHRDNDDDDSDERLLGAGAVKTAAAPRRAAENGAEPAQRHRRDGGGGGGGGGRRSRNEHGSRQ